MQDYHATYREIMTSLGITRTSKNKILHENLTEKKICLHLIPQNLSIDQKQDEYRICIRSSQQVVRVPHRLSQQPVQQKDSQYRLELTNLYVLNSPVVETHNPLINKAGQGLCLSRPIGMGCRRRVIALCMPQGGNLGIGNHVEIQLGLNPLTGSRERGERTGWVNI
ncbi:hypothetical protein EVAR_71519_1 [Eumeta japonica]|uniref:Uncharacterized protein n=1 Tax=Eumeta variegata TaxID=151549 RepID=A0A4C1THN4_EUMVA|nr:hypothetical protein EVAR_71519_1 [Eumeta japonica]